MPLVADRVKETTTTAGTGTLTLAGAATGFQSFSAAFGTGAVVYYVIAAGADWEIGIGTTGSGTLSRDTVLQSSNGDALVDWPAGTKDVFCAYVADRAVTTSDSATLTNKTIDDYTNNVGANSTHFRIKAGATLAKGDVVKAVGFTPGEQAIEVVKVASSSDVALGICEQALNTGNFGLAVVIGELFNVNTNGFTVGQTLYSNGSGGFTSTKPSSGLYQVLGWVVRANASNGVIAVNVVSPLYVEASTNTVNTAVIRDGSGNFAAGTITAALTGNATTATTLQTARTINGVSFNGSADITVAAAAGTLTGTTLASGVTASSLTSVGTLANVTVSGVTTLSAGTVSAPALTTAGDTNTGMFFPAADTIAFAEGGVEAMRLDSAGRVGIGTNNPTATLDVIGAVSARTVEFDGTTSGTVTVQPAATAGTWSLTLPTTAGSSGQVLTTNGSGVTSWSSVGSPAVVETTGSYNITAADAGKQIIYTGTTTTPAFFTGAGLASGLSTGQFVDVANNGNVNISIGGPQVFDSTYSTTPWANTSAVVTATYPNGKVLVATSTVLQRFNADGTPDATFTQIETNNSIFDISVSADNASVFVAGAFSSVTQNSNTVSRNYVVKLNGTTGIIDSTFIPSGAISASVTSVAISGTTVAVAYQGNNEYVNFLNASTGAVLSNQWAGNNGAFSSFGLQAIPFIKRHPTIANRFIAACNSGYFFIDGEGNYTFYNGTIFDFQTNLANSYTTSVGTVSPINSGSLLVTSTHIYWAVHSSANLAIWRVTLGTYGSGLVSRNTSTLSGTGSVFSVFSRATDGVIFVGTNLLALNSAATSLFNFPATLATTNPTIAVFTVNDGFNNGVGIRGASLPDGSLLLCNVVVSGANIRIAKTLTTLEVGATVAYPPSLSGATQIGGFTSVVQQQFRAYQTMRLQKMSNGQLLVSQRNTPYQ